MSVLANCAAGTCLIAANASRLYANSIVTLAQNIALGRCFCGCLASSIKSQTTSNDIKGHSATNTNENIELPECTKSSHICMADAQRAVAVVNPENPITNNV